MCKAEGVKIPYDKIGPEVAPSITGNAIIQHMAKLRKRTDAKAKDEDKNESSNEDEPPTEGKKRKAPGSPRSHHPMQTRHSKKPKAPTKKTNKTKGRGRNAKKANTEDIAQPDPEGAAWWEGEQDEEEQDEEASSVAASDEEEFIAVDSLLVSKEGRKNSTIADKRGRGGQEVESKVVILRPQQTSSNHFQSRLRSLEQGNASIDEHLQAGAGGLSQPSLSDNNLQGSQANWALANQAEGAKGGHGQPMLNQSDPLNAAETFNFDPANMSNQMSVHGTNTMPATAGFDPLTQLAHAQSFGSPMEPNMAGYPPTTSAFRLPTRSYVPIAPKYSPAQPNHPGAASATNPTQRSRQPRSQHNLGSAGTFSQAGDGRTDFNGYSGAQLGGAPAFSAMSGVSLQTQPSNILQQDVPLFSGVGGEQSFFEDFQGQEAPIIFNQGDMNFFQDTFANEPQAQEQLSYFNQMNLDPSLYNQAQGDEQVLETSSADIPPAYYWT